VFTFSVPANVELSDQRDKPAGIGTFSLRQQPSSISLEQARKDATFTIVIPSYVPAGFEVESIEHYWVSEMAKERRSHADWVLFRYTDSSGNWLAIAQGFGGSGLTASGFADPPDASRGNFTINGQPAEWTSGVRRDNWAEWQPEVQKSLRWRGGNLGTSSETSSTGEMSTGSPLSYGISSNVLSVDELKRVADSLQ
jgi:hypothetical protein